MSSMNGTDYQAPVYDSTGYYQNYQYPSTPVSNQYYNTQAYNFNGYYNAPQNYNAYSSCNYYPQTPESGYNSTNYNSNDESDSFLSYNTEVAASSAAQILETKEDLEDGSIKVNLSNSKLWSKFNNLTCEMILTKQGRRMFPTLQYEIDNLEPTKKYNVFIDFIQTESNSMKFNAGKWIPSSTPASEQKKTSVYLHPDSPNTGSFWMKNEVIFSKVKLTNNKKNPDSHMLMNSMHKYIPRIHVVEVNNENSIPETFMFNETKFIAVTAYQNTDVTQLKIDNNPFAKGFRENATREYENAVLISSDRPTINQSSPIRSVQNQLPIQPQSTPNHLPIQYQSTPDRLPIRNQNDYNYYYMSNYYGHHVSISNMYQSIPMYQYDSTYQPLGESNYVASKNKKRTYIESNEGDFYYQETDEKRRRC